MSSDLLIFYFVFGFVGFVLLAFGIVALILWNRRKYIFTNFLNDSGQWERKSWKPSQLGKTFDYDNSTYKFDIKKCTRDNVNRPIAHYYKGNPEQQIFDLSNKNKSIPIGTAQITTQDFRVLMLSKVLRDIFQDEDVMNLLMAILIIEVVAAVIIIIIVLTHNPACTLQDNNQTINIIAKGVLQAIKK